MKKELNGSASASKPFAPHKDPIIDTLRAYLVAPLLEMKHHKELRAHLGFSRISRLFENLANPFASAAFQKISSMIVNNKPEGRCLSLLTGKCG